MIPCPDGQQHQSGSSKPCGTRGESIRSFKPKPLRSAKHMADTACHVLRSTTRLGLTWVLGVNVGFVANLSAITSTILGPEVQLLTALAVPLGVFALLHRRHLRTPKQRRLVVAALLLWCLVPASLLLGAAFAFSGQAQVRGIEFNEPAALTVWFSFGFAVVGAVVLVALGRGVRLNVLAAVCPLIPLLGIVCFSAVSAIVGVGP